MEEKRLKAIARHGERYSFEKTNFSLSNFRENLFTCQSHGVFSKSLRDFFRIEHPCPRCLEAHLREKKKLKTKAGFDYLNTNFDLPDENLNEVLCRKHGKLIISLKDHFRYKNGGCRKCDSEWSSSSQRMPLEKFISLAQAKYSSEKYDYSRVHQFKNQHEPVAILCPLEGHGLFFKTPANHLHIKYSQGCPRCANERSAARLSLTIDDFLIKAGKIHGSKYQYKNVSFKNGRDKIDVECKACGSIFKQRIFDHLSGNGCRECGRKKTLGANLYLTTDFVIEKCKSIWGDTYDYSNVRWVNDETPIEVICKKHGSVFIDYQNHVGLKRGCKFCGSTRRIKQNEWLDYCEVPESSRHREVTIRFPDKSYFFVDGFVPETNTAYEFNGDYFHGNPEKYLPEVVNQFTGRTMAEEFNRTQKKREKLERAGYRVIEIWESDWDKLRKNII
jgi:hypothetical protein